MSANASPVLCPVSITSTTRRRLNSHRHDISSSGNRSLSVHNVYVQPPLISVSSRSDGIDVARTQHKFFRRTGIPPCLRCWCPGARITPAPPLDTQLMLDTRYEHPTIQRRLVIHIGQSFLLPHRLSLATCPGSNWIYQLQAIAFTSPPHMVAFCDIDVARTQQNFFPRSRGIPP